ncbi:plasmid stabilization protein [Streptomyces armeniacus]|uniref:Plasmid stabilization protein n=1 Tax=Streptomyces armeniacus TaxID=83291 RepID=A0A345XVH7_9ACTN|nr:plasmid stabilization protein [Streptomyces armeniacus]AXK35643.1 plasmid stabilization protein [Streptomyces armeniacus]
MPQGATAKQERQYEHIKEGAKKRGASTGRAKEIASRTVNKERAQKGEASRRSRTSVKDKPAPVRGGERSHRGSVSPTRDQLYNEAKQRGVEGRSKMNKQQLQRALGK